MNPRDLRGLTELDPSFQLPLDRPFTAATAAAEGVPRHQLTWLVKEGFMRRPIKGVYLATQAGDSPLLRAQSLRLVVPSDAIVCDRHAGWVQGAKMVLAPNEHLELQPISMFLPSGRGRLRNGLASSGERLLLPEDVTVVHGVPVTTILRTAWDLAMVRFADRAISGIDAMHRLPGFPHEAFQAGFERFRGRRWVTTLRAIGPLADGRSESPGESVLRLRGIQCGIPTLTPQIEVRRSGILIARMDLAHEGLRCAAEYDGLEWHSSPAQQAHDRARRAQVAAEDWVVKSFTRTNVFGQHRDCEELLIELMREARSRQGLRPDW